VNTVIAIVAVALIFDFINGFHDAANSIATVVSTRVLSPRLAVVWAAFFNFVAFLVFGLHVANTIGRGIVTPAVIDSQVIVAALLGAVAWDLITWHFGIPSSSSHALIGGLVGAALAKTRTTSVLELTGIFKTGISIVASPVLGLLLALVIMFCVFWIFRRHAPYRIDRWFRSLQLVSAAMYSLGHGGNDAQKTMGIIAVLIYGYRVHLAAASGYAKPEFHVDLWIVLACHAAMGLGTLAGGWRIVKTMGMKITKLKPVHGFCAETAGAITLFLATGLGIPVSTTHTITGAIVGVGSMNNASGVRWDVAGRIVWAWLLTIPASGAIAALAYALFGVAAVFTT
jgi:inorganic phosphate transporter, PiT family